MLSGESNKNNAESDDYLPLYSNSCGPNDPYTPTISEYQQHKSAKKNELSTFPSSSQHNLFVLLIKIKKIYICRMNHMHIEGVPS